MNCLSEVDSLFKIAGTSRKVRNTSFHMNAIMSKLVESEYKYLLSAHTLQKQDSEKNRQ